MRPVDPASQLPAAFALVTYAQGICALRCLQTLNGCVIKSGTNSSDGEEEEEEEDGESAGIVIKVKTSISLSVF